MSAQSTEREFTWLEGLAYCGAAIAIQLTSEMIAQWGTYFYSPTAGTGRTVYVAIGLVGIIFITGRIFDAFTDPVIGRWSDRTKSRRARKRWWAPEGRRRPFIFWGSILMTGNFILFWYPPFAPESTGNLIFGTVVVCLHWIFFTLCVVPWLALGPEIARSKQARVKLGAWMALGMILGLAAAVILPGQFIEMLDPARHPVDGAEAAYSAAGYQRTAIIFAVTALILFQFFVWVVRERFDSAIEPARASTASNLRDVAANFPFIIYLIAFLTFSIGNLAAQRVIPYWAEAGLGGSEAWVSLLMLPFIGSALFTALVITPVLGRIMPIKWLFFLSIAIITVALPMMFVIGRAPLSTPLLPEGLMTAWMGLLATESVLSANRALLGACLFGFAGIGQGITYVLMTPLMGEIIDFDEQRSGERREALYNGFSGIAFKLGQSVSILLATQSMSRFGNSVENPTGILIVGPIAGFCGLIACIAILFYPRLHVTPETTEEFLEELEHEGPGQTTPAPRE